MKLIIDQKELLAAQSSFEKDIPGFTGLSIRDTVIKCIRHNCSETLLKLKETFKIPELM